MFEESRGDAESLVTEKWIVPIIGRIVNNNTAFINDSSVNSTTAQQQQQQQQ
jgi:hypothetical protein